ncbi:MAG: four helix bundle protein [Myxococcota bacterium]
MSEVENNVAVNGSKLVQVRGAGHAKQGSGGGRLRVLDDIVAMAARVHRIIERLKRKDRDLANQLRRAVMSVGLNAAEAERSRGAKRGAMFDIAMASGREAIMALRLAGAVGHVDAASVAAEVDRIDRIVAILYKVAHR